MLQSKDPEMFCKKEGPKGEAWIALGRDKISWGYWGWIMMGNLAIRLGHGWRRSALKVGAFRNQAET